VFKGYFVLKRLCPKDRSVATTLQPGTKHPRTFRPGTFCQGTLIFNRSKELLHRRRDWASWTRLYSPLQLAADFFLLWSMKKELQTGLGEPQEHLGGGQHDHRRSDVCHGLLAIVIEL
jgi:hypothetical protein